MISYYIKTHVVVVCIQLLLHVSALMLTLLLNVPVLLSNVLLRLTTAAGDTDVPVFSTYLGMFYLLMR